MIFQRLGGDWLRLRVDERELSIRYLHVGHSCSISQNQISFTLQLSLVLVVAEFQALCLIHATHVQVVLFTDIRVS